MADVFYEEKRDVTAHNQFVKRGFVMTLVSESGESFDANTGIKTVGTVTSTPVTGITRFFSQDEIDNVNIKANDIQALISGKELAVVSIVPDTTMRLIAKGVTYNVVRVTPTQPGGIDVLYRLQIRR